MIKTFKNDCAESSLAKNALGIFSDTKSAQPNVKKIIEKRGLLHEGM